MTRMRKNDTTSTMSKFAKDLSISPRQTKLDQLKQLVGKQVTLPLASIRTDENIRSDLGVEEDSFKELVASIQEHGVLQNIVVELREIDDPDLFELVCVEGHRRIAASKQLGIETIPSFLKSFRDKGERNKTALACTLKEDLHPLDRVTVYADWIASGATLEQVAERDNKNIKTIQRFMKILEWPPSARDMVRYNKKLFPTWWLFQNILQKSLTTRQIESLIKKRISVADEGQKENAGVKQKNPISPEDKKFAAQLSGRIGTATRMKQRAGKKYLEIELTEEVKSMLQNI